MRPMSDAVNIDLPLITYALPQDPMAKRTMIRAIERLSGSARLQRAYRAVSAEDWERRVVWDHALAHLDITLRHDPNALHAVPDEGPLIIIANHPFGVVDGLALCSLAARLRAEHQALVHSALCREERLNKYLLPIEFEPTRVAQQRSIESRRQALALLHRGGALVFFPAAAISTATPPFGRAVDWEWNPLLGRLIHMSRATVLPVYFYGQNSLLFQVASAINPTLRLSLVMREVRRAMGKPVEMEVGTPVPYAQMAAIKSRSELTRHLRDVTHGLARRQ